MIYFILLYILQGLLGITLFLIGTVNLINALWGSPVIDTYKSILITILSYGLLFVGLCS